MRNQCKVIFYKFRRFLLFYLAIAFMAGMGFFSGFVKFPQLFPNANVYDAFVFSVCDTSLVFMLALTTSWFLGSDFGNRTIHHELTLGYSRWSVMLVRELPVMLSGVILHLTFVFATMLGLACKTGFPIHLFGTQDIFWCLTVMLQVMALESILVLITFLCAKASSAIAVSACFTIITCNVLRNFLDGPIFTRSVFCFAPDNSWDTLIPASIVSIVTLAAAIAATYLVFRKKDI